MILIGCPEIRAKCNMMLVKLYENIKAQVSNSRDLLHYITFKIKFKHDGLRKFKYNYHEI